MKPPPLSVRILSALGVLFLATAVIEAMGLAWTQRPALAALEAALGAAFLSAAGGSRDPGPNLRWIETAAWAISSLLLPQPWQLTAAIAAPATLLAGAGSGPVGMMRRLAGGIREAIQILVTTGLAMSIATPILLRDHGPDGLAGPLAWALRLLGTTATAWTGGLGLETLHGAPNLPVGWALLGVPLAMALCVASTVRVIQRFAPGSARDIVRTVATTLVSSAASTLLAILTLLQYENYLPFEGAERPVALLYAPTWRAVLVGLLWLPIVVRATAGRHGARGTDTPARGIGVAPYRGPLGASLLLAGLAALCGLGLLIEEPGQRKPGRVVIDEGHSQWETVKPAYDTDWYGYDSGYTYAAIADFLSHHYSLGTNTGAITPSLLREVDVLILKTPTRAYEPAERAAILDFVRSGGGLLLVGEHTNVWGSGVYLNALARPLGFEFRYDVVFDLRKRYEELYETPSLGHHPSLANLRRFLFAVSCSIRPDALGTRPVMWAGGLWSLDIDYAVSNFYPQAELGWGAHVGPHVQCVARHMGRGRVLGFTDSTVWSNFSAMLAGKPELLLGMIEWLDRRNRFPDPLPWALPLVWLVAALAAAWTWGGRARLGVSLALVLLGACAGARAAEWLNAASYHAPQPDQHLEEVEFLEDPGAFELGSWGFIEEPGRSYSIFYQWILRLGMFPRTHDVRGAPSARTRLAVAVSDSAGDARLLERWVRARLTLRIPVLLLLRDGTRPGQVAWLRDYALEAVGDTLREPRSLMVPGTGARWPLRWLAGNRLTGGHELLLGSEGERILVKSDKAPLYVVVGAGSFSDAWMGGDQGLVPDPALRRQFELEFSLIRGLARGNPVEELSAGASRELRVRSGGETSRPGMDRPGDRRSESARGGGGS